MCAFIYIYMYILYTFRSVRPSGGSDVGGVGVCTPPIHTHTHECVPRRLAVYVYMCARRIYVSFGTGGDGDRKRNDRKPAGGRAAKTVGTKHAAVCACECAATFVCLVADGRACARRNCLGVFLYINTYIYIYSFFLFFFYRRVRPFDGSNDRKRCSGGP